MALSLTGAAGAQIATEATVQFPQQEATAAEVLLSLANQADLGFLAANLPDARRTFSLADTPLQDALYAVSEAYGLECATWHGLLLAEPAPPPELRSLAARLRAAVDPAVQPYLFQGPEVITREEPAPEILDAIRVIVKGEQGPEAYAKLAHACYSIAAYELYGILAWADSLERGTILFHTQPVRPEQQVATDQCGCAGHLVVERPRRDGADPLESHLQRLTYHGAGYDPFAAALREQRGLIPVEEYVRRLLDRARAEETPFAEDERLDAPQALEEQSGPAAALLQRLAAGSGLLLQCSADRGAVELTTRTDPVPLRDLLVALARLTHGCLVQRDDGYEVAAGACAGDRLCAAAPLPMWVWAASTTVERDLLRQRHLEALWAMLTPAAPDGPLGPPVALRDLGGAAQRAAALLLWGDLGARLAEWAGDLPRAGAGPGVWLYEIEGEQYELRTWRAVEVVSGLSYLTLKAELSGTRSVPMPLREIE